GRDRKAVAEAAAAAGVPEDLAPAESADDAAEIELELRNEVGLHARPAGLLVRTLSGIDAEVTVRLGDREADGHSVLALMSLGARQGDRVRVRATGPHAETALAKVKELVESDFGE
ncbi:HPr family phosphocarrier protein, partial [Amycolatopsis sp.]|uniref:HPr family phosphocarrier protein n=1 Tax=Amycolatopsis sp. TaxID=37632 RepID=UPI002D7E5451